MMENVACCHVSVLYGLIQSHWVYYILQLFYMTSNYDHVHIYTSTMYFKFVVFYSNLVGYEKGIADTFIMHTLPLRQKQKE